MENLRNKRRLTSAVVVFLLTFVVGAAFALSAGVLEVEGIVRVSPDLIVIWADGNITAPATESSDSPLVYTSHTVVAGDDGRPRQRIVWSIDFGTFTDPDTAGIAPGIAPLLIWDDFDDFDHFVMLMAQAENISAIDAEILNPTFGFSNENLALDLGLMADFVENSDQDFTGPIASGDLSDTLIVGVVWYPSMMADLDDLPDRAAGEYWWTVYLYIEFDYVPA